MGEKFDPIDEEPVEVIEKEFFAVEECGKENAPVAVVEEESKPDAIENTHVVEEESKPHAVENPPVVEEELNPDAIENPPVVEKQRQAGIVSQNLVGNNVVKIVETGSQKACREAVQQITTNASDVV